MPIGHFDFSIFYGYNTERYNLHISFEVVSDILLFRQH